MDSHDIRPPCMLLIHRSSGQRRTQLHNALTNSHPLLLTPITVQLAYIPHLSIMGLIISLLVGAVTAVVGAVVVVVEAVVSAIAAVRLFTMSDESGDRLMSRIARCSFASQMCCAAVCAPPQVLVRRREERLQRRRDRARGCRAVGDGSDLGVDGDWVPVQVPEVLLLEVVPGLPGAG
ncbi:hypothetical protein C8Q77DRAFT_1114257 [Trametes polyzona]|nr:hypothetical protein C8Q77DRAFT_1114257 [Trametes polyzona]